MVTSKPKCILLDIEGTTSSIQFVYDVMFPFARRELSNYLGEHWDQPETQTAAAQIASDEGFESLADLVKATASPDEKTAIETAVIRQMDADIKANGLKQLQGLIWKAGFKSGEMSGHVFPDVKPALERWKAAGIDLRIYSSGSVRAQQLFFGHSIEGNLLDFFSAHYDTEIGSKKEAESYRRIAADCQLPTEEILFVSDSVPELDAAAETGMQTAWSCRPENPVPDEQPSHSAITSFDQIVWS